MSKLSVRILPKTALQALVKSIIFFHNKDVDYEEIKRIKGPIKFVSDLYPGFWENNVSDDTYRYHFH